MRARARSFFSRSAKFLEDNDKAITALQRKEALKVIDVDNSGKMALIEYLLWKYKKTIGAVANASQGGNKGEPCCCIFFVETKKKPYIFDCK